MSIPFQHRRGSTATRTGFTPLSGELFFDTDTFILYIGDGVTVGGLAIGQHNVVLTLSKTTNYSVSALDTGTHFNNIGAVGTVVFSLPVTAVGLAYSFMVDAAQVVEILLQSGDKVAIGTSNSSTGANIQSDLPFCFISIECHKTGQWIASSIVGSWTVT